RYGGHVDRAVTEAAAALTAIGERLARQWSASGARQESATRPVRRRPFVMKPDDRYICRHRARVRPRRRVADVTVRALPRWWRTLRGVRGWECHASGLPLALSECWPYG